MTHFAREMAFYSAYHQERTNVWIHVFGVPLIIFSAFTPLAGVTLIELGGYSLTLATLYFLATSLYYLSLDRLMGGIAVLLYGSLCWAAHEVAALGMNATIVAFLGGQILGWSSQIFGHLHFEKNRPAFYENIIHSFVSAPIFVIADVLFHFGIKKELQREVALILADTGRLRQFSGADIGKKQQTA